jgi:hypothetical protein
LKAPTETATVQSPAELALVESYGLAGDEAVETAERLAAAAVDRVERLETDLATSPTHRAVEFRKLLEQQHQAVHRFQFLASLSAGEDPDPLPATPDVAAELVTRFARARPGSFGRLMGLCQAAASSADARDATSGTRLAMLRDEFRAGGIELGRFTEAFARELGERTKHREAANRFRAAAATAQQALKSHIGDALGNLADLRSGLKESLALARQTDPVLSQLAGELERIDSDLVRLGLDDQEAEPGAIGAALQAQRQSLAEQISARKRESLATTGSSAGEIVDLARQGDAAALGQIIAITRQRPMAFGPGLADRIVEVMAEALAESADVFAELVLMPT